jgi:hypothetical protein
LPPPPAPAPEPGPTLPAPPAPKKPPLKLPRAPADTAQGDALCRQSEQAAKAGNIEAAVSLYRSCAATGGSSQAQSVARLRIRAHAPGTVTRRAYNGDCDGARSAAQAAASIGEGAGAQAALGRTRCG